MTIPAGASSNPSIMIVGAGASGVIMAAHLLRAGGADLRITLVEKRDVVGRGIAYGTNEPEHRLNVRATNMSALADEPGHFVEWLRGRGAAADDFARVYAPRATYGKYLEAVLQEAHASGPPARLRIVSRTCVAITPHAASVEAALSDGTTLVAQAAVLATGHEEKPRSGSAYAVRPGAADDGPLQRDAPVLILGTGLSMVDAWLSLQWRGHRGPVTILSRRGLLPACHQPTQPIELQRADVPLGAGLAGLTQWFRARVRQHQAQGGDWRDVVDGLRPFNQDVWRNWPEAARRRFFEHLKPRWDVHRHRMAPDIHRRLAAAVAAGAVRLVAGRLAAIEKAEGGWEVAVHDRRMRATRVLQVARVYDCSGIMSDPAQGTNPAVLSLLAKGHARPDPLRVGLDVNADCALLDRLGQPSPRLFAIGPLTRGAFLEIEAVPDIRLQCRKLAAMMVATAACTHANATRREA